MREHIQTEEQGVVAGRVVRSACLEGLLQQFGDVAVQSLGQLLRLTSLTEQAIRMGRLGS